MQCNSYPLVPSKTCFLLPKFHWLYEFEEMAAFFERCSSLICIFRKILLPRSKGGKDTNKNIHPSCSGLSHLRHHCHLWKCWHVVGIFNSYIDLGFQKLERQAHGLIMHKCNTKEFVSKKNHSNASLHPPPNMISISIQTCGLENKKVEENKFAVCHTITKTCKDRPTKTFLCSLYVWHQIPQAVFSFIPATEENKWSGRRERSNRRAFVQRKTKQITCIIHGIR